MRRHSVGRLFDVVLVLAALPPALGACGEETSGAGNALDGGFDAPMDADQDATGDVSSDADAGADGGADADASCTPEDCSNHCSNGVQDCGEGSTDCGGGCAVCPTEQIVLDDFGSAGCKNGCSRTAEGNGTWQSSGGWVPHGFDDRVVYDLGRGVACGTLHVEVDGFDPYAQFFPKGVSATYVEVISLYEGHDDDHSSTSGSQINVIYAPCFDCTDDADHRKCKVTTGLVSTCDWRDDFYTGPIFDPTNGNTRFSFDLRWSPKGVDLEVKGDQTGDEWVYYSYPSYPAPCHCSQKTPALRYLNIGRSRIQAGGNFDGPVFTQVELNAYDCDAINW